MNNAASVSEKLRMLTENVSRANVRIGANLIITKFTIKNRIKLTELLIECGFKRLIFLRYKPIADHDRWNSENPDGGDLEIFQNWLTHAKRQYPQVMLRVDCAAAFLMRHLDPLTAKRAGINGCTAGQRIISIAPDGCVYPCSQLVGHGYYAGDLKYDSFKAIWYDIKDIQILVLIVFVLTSIVMFISINCNCKSLHILQICFELFNGIGVNL